MELTRPLCIKCNKCLAAKSGSIKSHGKQYYKRECTGCAKERVHGKRHPYKVSKKYIRPWIQYKKDRCEACGFMADYPCQLDVDHIDGNRDNNNPNNFQTLCANCHRLKTFLSKDCWNKGYTTKKDCWRELK